MKSLATLFHGTDRIERELRRTGALDEPPESHPWLSDCSLNELDRVVDLAQCKLTELDRGIVPVNADAEQVKARIDVRARLGLPAVDCVGMVEHEARIELDGQLTPLRLAFDSNPRSERPRLYRDVEGQQQFVACDCLSDALDAAGDLSQASDKAVLRAAKKLHTAFAKEAAKQDAERAKRHEAAQRERLAPGIASLTARAHRPSLQPPSRDQRRVLLAPRNQK